MFIGQKADLKPGKVKKAAGTFISAAFYGLVGWGLLKDVMKAAWMLGYLIFKTILFPDLFPGLAFDTPVLT